MSNKTFKNKEINIDTCYQIQFLIDQNLNNNQSVKLNPLDYFILGCKSILSKDLIHNFIKLLEKIKMITEDYNNGKINIPQKYRLYVDLIKLNDTHDNNSAKENFDLSVLEFPGLQNIEKLDLAPIKQNYSMKLLSSSFKYNSLPKKPKAKTESSINSKMTENNSIILENSITSLELEVKKKFNSVKILEKQEVKLKDNYNFLNEVPSRNSIETQLDKKKIAKKEFLESNENICPICFNKISNLEIIYLSHCGHVVHEFCFLKYFNDEITIGKTSITCIEYECNQEVNLRDFLYMISPKMLSKLESNSLKFFSKTHPDEVQYCFTPNCQYFCIQDPCKNDFNCPNCSIRYCVKCKKEYHHKLDCMKGETQTENEITKFKNYVDKNNLKQCGKCKSWVEKSSGCDYILCLCGNTFCFICGNDIGSCRHGV